MACYIYRNFTNFVNDSSPSQARLFVSMSVRPFVHLVTLHGVTLIYAGQKIIIQIITASCTVCTSKFYLLFACFMCFLCVLVCVLCVFMCT